MPFNDITNEFREFVEASISSIPESKRCRVVKPLRNDASLDRTYITEAYNILKHIVTLTRMLANIRTPYLNVDARSSPLSRQHTRNFDLNEASTSWSNIRYLSNEERDQIDLQARVIIKRCSERVKEIEALESRRVELVNSKMNPLTRFLPSRLRQDESTLSSDVLAAHHASIAWYLSRRLAEASQTQKELQEERVKRQLERTKSLGAGAGQEAVTLASRNRSLSSNSSGSRGTGNWLGNTIAATIGAPPPSDSQRMTFIPTPSESSLVSDDDDDEMELSASQILQFEAENANILRNAQDTLESVQEAESRLMDISALQLELVAHLTKQTELTNQLYEDALATTSTVEKGNAQLKEAKRRAKDSRLFILVFLVGASLSLLFLHYY